MSLFAHPRFLRNVLWFDAASCAVSSALHLFAGSLLAPWLGLSEALLASSGLALLVVIALASYAASCEPIPRAPVLAMIAGNWLWAAACLALLFTGAAGTLPGQAYLVAQAAVVVVLAELEWIGLRRYPVQGWA
ncbi:MAG: hypothetical protein HY854_22960 [Burkholderiales bacterium]|nr:hypothetical protein [Burkholderiales bacterium]